MPRYNQFLSPFGDLEKYFITENWLIDQYVGSQLWVWGSGGQGSSFVRLGTNEFRVGTSTPVTTFAGGSNWVQTSVGSFGAVAAIKNDGTLWTWCEIARGDLTSGRVSTPVTTFAGGTNWKQVSCGSEMMGAIKTDGTLWMWGSNLSGALGTNDENFRTTPVTTFAGGNDWKQLTVGYRRVFAIKTDGSLWCWGSNDNSSLGVNQSTETSICTPVTTFAGGNDWKTVSAGSSQNSGRGSHTVAIKTDGTLWVWGLNTSAQLGINNGIRKNTPVTTFAGGTNWKIAQARQNSTIAIKEDGTLWGWGDNAYGQLGTNDTIRKSTPVTTFAGGNTWKQVSGGGVTSAAIKTDGTLWLWGFGGSGGSVSYGVLGMNDNLINRSTPATTFAGGTNWKYISIFNSAYAVQTGTDTRNLLS